MKKMAVLCVLGSLAFFISGCATSQCRQKDLEVQGLKNRIMVLQSQIQSKDEEMASLKLSLDSAAQEKEAWGSLINKKKVVGEAKSRPNTKEIQAALKNAGFESGAIDGRMGKRTRQAIKAFQKANNLPVDGKAGKETWGLLQKYLYKKVK